MSETVETGRTESTNGPTESEPKAKAESKPKKPKAERAATAKAERAAESEPVPRSEPTQKIEPAPKAEPVTETGPASQTEAVSAARTGGVRLSRPVLIVAGVVLVLALAASVTFAVLLGLRAATDRAGEQALATARAYAVTVTSYDYQHLDQNFNDVLDGATGEFKDQYSGASSTLKQLIVSAKATAKGTVLGAGVASATRDQVQVVAFVDQAITNAANPAPRQDRNRVTMTLVKIDGRWLVSKLELM